MLLLPGGFFVVDGRTLRPPTVREVEQLSSRDLMSLFQRPTEEDEGDDET